MDMQPGADFPGLGGSLAKILTGTYLTLILRSFYKSPPGHTSRLPIVFSFQGGRDACTAFFNTITV